MDELKNSSNWHRQRLIATLDAQAKEIERLKTRVENLGEEASNLEQNVCDSCLEYEDDGTPLTTYGWNENRVEGQIPCACVSESGPYQVLEATAQRYREVIDSILSDAVIGPECCSASEVLHGIIKQAQQALTEPTKLQPGGKTLGTKEKTDETNQR